jgi:hypothetical protein
MKELGWIDPTFNETPDETGESIFGKPVTGLVECENCGRKKEFKDIFFDYCRSCVHEAH